MIENILFKLRQPPVNISAEDDHLLIHSDKKWSVCLFMGKQF